MPMALPAQQVHLPLQSAPGGVVVGGGFVAPPPPVVMSAPPMVPDASTFLSSSVPPIPAPAPQPVAVVQAAAPPRTFALFGVEVADGAVLSQQYGEPNPIPAVRVINVTGPSSAAGLQPGDLISSIDGKQVASLTDFNAIVSSVPPRSEVKVVFERDGQLLGTDVQTEETTRAPMASIAPLGRAP
eukprot:RCo047345